MKPPATPYYLIDEKRLLRNLKVIARVRTESGAKSVLALKCFATWGVFKLMREYMDGTTSSSLYEARLGREEFGREVHAFSVAYNAAEMRAVARLADKVIFNSTTQLERLHRLAAGKPLGLRVNPGVSYSHYDLADPARKHSRLGVIDRQAVASCAHLLSGLMFHFNCENDDFGNLAAAMDHIGRRYGAILRQMSWISFGGGIAFTKPGYPLREFCAKLSDFSRRHGVQVYLEPGDAAVTDCAELVTTVLDVVRNGADIAVVDASTEAHMLDHLVYRTSARLAWPPAGRRRYIIAGRSCLAGDVFGTYGVKSALKPGATVRFAEAAGYTMVKKNWFNGLPMPAIVIRRLNGRREVARQFGYQDFKRALS